MTQMDAMIGASTADFTFSVAGADTSELKVTRFEGLEAISRLFSFRIDLASDNADIDLAALVGQDCVLEIAAEGATRYVHGIVRSFQRRGRGSRHVHYACEMVPQHWLLTRRFGSRIFQQHNCPDMTVPGIVRKVLSDAGIPADRYRFALHGQYEAREYVVQYRETELDFIARLLEEEGIFYFFEQSETGHVMVFGDTPAAHVMTPLAEEYPYRAPSGLVPEREHVFEFAEQQEIAIGSVSLDDFNFAKPGMDLVSQAKAEQFTSLAWEDYPGDFGEKPAGQRLAQIRLEERQAQRHQIELTATARGLMAGYLFALVEHPNEESNRRYLVTNVTHRGHQPQSGEEEAPNYQDVGYEAQICCMPAEIPYRHPCCTPCPRVQGTQTAVVVGPKDEEIYVDEYGRVKVQFHWDKEGNYDENSSCWIRVSQVWAGGEYGAMFMPRVGHEVIVDFLEGDPDRPIIVGRVHNGDLMPLFPPDEKHLSGIWSQSTKGGDGCSALVFDDEKDNEMVFLHSQRDLEITAEDDCREHYGDNLDLVVGDSRYELIYQDHQCEVKLDHRERVGGNKSREVGGSYACSVGGAHAESCGSYWLSAGKGEVVIESTAAITLKVGGSFIKVHGGGVDIMGPVVNINSGGSPGNGCGAPFGEFEEVYEAEYAEPPGYDVSYNKSNPPPGDEPPQSGDDPAQQAPPAEKQTTWIEIELVDEAGQPWPNEPYEIVTPEGEKVTGTLDASGQAHVPLRTDGAAQISFPRLDQEAWRRA